MSNGKWQPSRACWQPLNEEYGNLISPIRPANETAFPRRCEQKANDLRSLAPSLSQEAPSSPFHVDKRAVNFIFSRKQSPSLSFLTTFPRLGSAGIPGLSLPLAPARASFPTHGGVTICRCHPSPSPGPPFCLPAVPEPPSVRFATAAGASLCPTVGMWDLRGPPAAAT